MNLLLKLVGSVTGNPMLLIWLTAAAFGLGAVSGGGLAWKVQGWRLDALQDRYDGFVAATKAEGEKAAITAAATKKADEKRKEVADHENAAALTALRADNLRLRNTRTGGSYLPAAAAGAVRPDRITFDRAELESAIQRLDAGVSGVAEKGDEARVNLDTARKWAQDPESGLKMATAMH